MKNRDGLEILASRIFPHRRIDRFQKLIPQIIESYLAKKPLLKIRGRRERKFVKEINYKLDQITITALEKPCGYSGRHPLDIKDDPALVADMIIRHCIDHKLRLQTKILEFSKDTGITKTFLDRRYKKRKEIETDREILASFGKKSNFYILMMDLDGKC